MFLLLFPISPYCLHTIESKHNFGLLGSRITALHLAIHACAKSILVRERG